MIDNQGRNIDYIRISITDRCNMRCGYCMPREGVPSMEHEEILSFDEILRIGRALSSLGFQKIKVTGGEPLVRKGCTDLVAALKGLPGIRKVTLTTNGVLLEENMEALAAAGIDGINISLDTLDREEYISITNRDLLDRALAGLAAAKKHPEIPLKINCVPALQREEQLLRLAEIARESRVHVRFIEMMPIGLGAGFPCITQEHILKLLEEKYGPALPYEKTLGNGPGRYYTLEGFQGKIGFISAVTHKFCDSCNRVRLTADGYLKACLQYQEGKDLKSLMRQGCSEEELTEAIRQVLLHKPAGHHFEEKKVPEGELRLMAQIGG